MAKMQTYAPKKAPSAEKCVTNPGTVADRKDELMTLKGSTATPLTPATAQKTTPVGGK
jgi:hypothetical protein